MRLLYLGSESVGFEYAWISKWHHESDYNVFPATKQLIIESHAKGHRDRSYKKQSYPQGICELASL